jgi:threonine dehydratase
VLGPTDEITYFEYSKKTSREKGPAIIGIEVQDPSDFEGLTKRLNDKGFVFEYLNDNSVLFQYLI